MFSYIWVASFTKAIPFLVTIALTYYLSPTEFGFVALLLATAGIAASLTNFGFGVIIVRETHHANDSHLRELYTNSWYISLFILGTLVLCYWRMSSTNSENTLSSPFVLQGILLGFLLGRYDVLSKYFVATNMRDAFTKAELGKALITAILSLVLVSQFVEFSVEGRVVGILAGIAMSLIYATKAAKKLSSEVFVRLKHLSYLLKTGTLTLPQSISNWIKLGADKLIIGVVIGVEALGSYAFMLTLCSAISIIGTGINNTFVATAMKLYKANDIASLRSIRRQYVLLLLLATVVICSAILLASQYLWPKDYDRNVFVIVCLSITFYLQGIYLLYAKYFLHTMRVAKLGIVNLLLSLSYVVGLLLYPFPSVEVVSMLFFAYNAFLTSFVVFASLQYESLSIKLN